MKKIKAGTMGRPLGKKDMVFALIYAEGATPYKDYRDESKRHLSMPVVLANFRWDGKLGFPGGNVEDHHKTLEEAVMCELYEETGIGFPEERLELLATFANDDRHITSYIVKTDYEVLRLMQEAAPRLAVDYHSENCGCIIMQMHEKSIKNIMTQTFSGTGKEELALLIEKFREKDLVI